MGTFDDIVSNIKNLVQNLSIINSTISSVFPRITGSFTLAAAATTTVAQAGIKANGLVVLIPADASAGTLMGSAKALYVSAVVAGTGFTVATASGGNAVGTETFSYAVVNPS